MSVIIKRKEASLTLLRESWTSYIIKKDSPHQKYKVIKYDKGVLVLQNKEGFTFDCFHPKLDHYDLVQEPNTVPIVKKKAKTLKPQYISLKGNSNG